MLARGQRVSARFGLVTLNPLLEVFTMNDMVRYDPWSLVPRLQDEINRVFGNVLENDSSGATAGWVPAVDRSAGTR